MLIAMPPLLGFPPAPYPYATFLPSAVYPSYGAPSGAPSHFVVMPPQAGPLPLYGLPPGQHSESMQPRMAGGNQGPVPVLGYAPPPPLPMTSGPVPLTATPFFGQSHGSFVPYAAGPWTPVTQVSFSTTTS